MNEYIVAKTNKGFIIKDIPERGMLSVQMYAFSTLKELTDYLPSLLEPQMPLELNVLGDGK